MLLAIDTATRTMSLALHDGRMLIAEQTWLAGYRHTIMLAPAIHRMFENSNVSVKDLKAVAVAIGPGSYTGLRIGVSLAKAMAAARSLPLVGVTTLEILAAGQPFSSSRSILIAIVEAGRSRIIAQHFRSEGGHWVAIDKPRNTDWLQLFNMITENTYITGDVSQAGQELLQMKKRQGVPIMLVNASYRTRRAGFMAEEALRRLTEEREADYDAANLRPIYVKSSR